MMLIFVGDILNWLAAGVVFPLMFLPLAVLVGKGKNTLIVWFAIVSAVLASGVLFAWATPILSIAPPLNAIAMVAAIMIAVIALMALTGGAVKYVEGLAPVFEHATRFAARCVMWLLLAMALVQFGVVVLRYVFGINYIFMQESITYMHGAVFLAAAGYALITDDHVRVDIFYGQASPKRKALIDLLGTYLLLFPVCLLLLWTASPYVGNSWAVREGSTETSGIQAVFLMKSLVPIFATLIAMAGFTIAAKAGAVLKERG